MSTRHLEQMPLGEIAPALRNPKGHDNAGIRSSVSRFGFLEPLVLDERTGKLVAGHGRLEDLLGREAAGETPPDGVGALEDGTWLAPVVRGWSSASDDEAHAAGIALNRFVELGGWNTSELIDLLGDLANTEGGLDGVGYTMSDLEDLIAGIDRAEAVAYTDKDAAPRAPKTARSKAGDIWILGEHRLVVGDALDPASYPRALAGARAEIVWTDPPYNVGYQRDYRLDPQLAARMRRHTDGLSIDNDDMTDDEFVIFLTKAFSATAANLKAGGAVYVCEPGIGRQRAFSDAFAATFALKQSLLWVKDRFVLGRQDYHWQHEAILYGWKAGAAHRWRADRTQTTLLLDDDIDPRQLTKAELLTLIQEIRASSEVIREHRPGRSPEHPTMKPVRLIERCLSNSSRPGDVVLDPFAGSGSTLIAAHHTGRKAALVELDPIYADVICRRWQEHTEIAPTLEATGEQHDFTDEDGDG